MNRQQHCFEGQIYKSVRLTHNYRTESIQGFYHEYKELRASQPGDFIAPHTEGDVHSHPFGQMNLCCEHQQHVFACFMDWRNSVSTTVNTFHADRFFCKKKKKLQ